MAADDKQIAGDHYKKLDPEPWNVIIKWNLGYLEGTALKYIARWRDKGGIDDIKKAIHFLEKLVEIHSSKPDASPTFTGAQSSFTGVGIKPMDLYPGERLHGVITSSEQFRNSYEPIPDGESLDNWIKRVNAQKALDDYHAQ